MKSSKLKDLSKGEFIRRKAESKVTWVKGDYVRELKKYSLHDFDDVNREMFMSGDKEVFHDFEF